MNILKVSKLNVAYDNISVLNNISFKVDEGDFLMIVGKNGSGKSTLLKTISGLKKESSGMIEYQINKDEVSYLEQVNTKNIDFPITTSEVIISGLQKPKKLFYSKEDYIKLDEMLKQFKIENIKTKKIGEISGGQKQRTLIARSIIKNPKLLILDEPLSGLDSKISNEVMEILKNLNNNNITIIMSVHDLEIAKKYATKILLLDEGNVIFNDKVEKWQGD